MITAIGVFSFGLLEDGDISVSVFPERKTSYIATPPHLMVGISTVATRLHLFASEIL